jgi:hypothetical protein
MRIFESYRILQTESQHAIEPYMGDPEQLSSSSIPRLRLVSGPDYSFVRFLRHRGTVRSYEVPLSSSSCFQRILCD